MRGMLLAAVLLAPVPALAQAGTGGIAGGGKAVNDSGTIAVASTSQQVMAANTSRVGCQIQAIGTDLWLAIDIPASNGGGSFYLPAGCLYVCPASAAPTGKISVWSATASAAFTAWEFTR
jgi:hypothetical protein